MVRDPGAGEEQRRRRGGQPVPGEGVDRDARPQCDTAEGVRDDSDGRRPALPAGRDDGHRRDVLATGVDRPNRLRHRREVDRVQREDAGRPDGGPAGQLRAPTARASAETTMMLRATVTTGTSQRVVPRRLDVSSAAPDGGPSGLEESPPTGAEEIGQDAGRDHPDGESEQRRGELADRALHGAGHERDERRRGTRDEHRLEDPSRIPRAAPGRCG